jgi:hypothetical protein
MLVGRDVRIRPAIWRQGICVEGLISSNRCSLNGTCSMTFFGSDGGCLRFMRSWCNVGDVLEMVMLCGKSLEMVVLSTTMAQLAEIS